MKLNKLLLALAASGIATSAFATNGYFAHGIGVKAKAMGGASIAYAEDGFGAASNPANLAQVKDGYSIGVSAFAPDRAVTGSGGGLVTAASHGGNEAADAFAIPEFAYSKKYNDKISFGVVVYGNGGMNTDYGKSMYDSSAAPGTAGHDRVTTSNMEQLFIAPTLSYRLNDVHTIGASLNLVHQTFEATGVGAFSGYTTNPGVTDPGNHGVDDSSGIGARFGWVGQYSNGMKVGAYYQPKTSMGKFDAYKDLFAEAGGFDTPETYGIGVAFDASPKTSVAFDIVQINYSGIRSLANKNLGAGATADAKLGGVNGNGFGWSDMTVYKLGLAHKLNGDTTIRAGWNYGEQPISKGELDFNLLAPAVVEHHFTFGLTKSLGKDSDFSMHAMYAPNVELTGTSSDGAGTGSISKLEMSQYEIGFQYSKKF